MQKELNAAFSFVLLGGTNSLILGVVGTWEGDDVINYKNHVSKNSRLVSLHGGFASGGSFARVKLERR